MIFSAPISPAMQSHFETRLAVVADFSGKMIDAVQKIAALNIQVAKTVFAESVESSRQVASFKTPADLVGHLSGQARPAMDKFQAYQRHVQRILAGTASALSQGVATQRPEAAGVGETFAPVAITHTGGESSRIEPVPNEAPADTTASIIDSLERVAKSSPAPTV